MTVLSVNTTMILKMIIIYKDNTHHFNISNKNRSFYAKRTLQSLKKFIHAYSMLIQNSQEYAWITAIVS